MKQFLLLIVLLPLILFAQSAPETIVFKAPDGLEITADLYLEHPKTAPMILLCHQAGYSRGEYVEIAKKLNTMGYNCMAIDQRSGKEVNGVINQTHQKAVDQNLATTYPDAIQDIETAFQYIKHGIKPDKIILWGSSYSASIVLYMAAVHHDHITATLAFSPGEYFEINGKKIASYTNRITCPTFITSAKKEYDQWKGIYANIESDKSYFLPDGQGKHGSKALWSAEPDSGNYWKAVSSFLNELK